MDSSILIYVKKRVLLKETGSDCIPKQNIDSIWNPNSEENHFVH